MKTRKTTSNIPALILAAMLLFSACGAPTSHPANMTPPAATTATVATATPAPTATLEPTATAMPATTETPEPTATATPEPTATPALAPTAKPTPTPFPGRGAPGIVRLYERKSRKLTTAFAGKWTKGRDIVVFYALPTKKASVEKVTSKSLIEKYWDGYRKMGYRIGYRVSFALKSGKVITLNIRSPKDAPMKPPLKPFFQYLEIYMYDNAQKDPDGDYGTYHLQEKFMHKETLITSIKLTAGKRIAEVTSIDLEAFVYKSNADFNRKTGEYIGPVSCAITIKRAN